MAVENDMVVADVELLAEDETVYRSVAKPEYSWL